MNDLLPALALQEAWQEFDEADAATMAPPAVEGQGVWADSSDTSSSAGTWLSDWSTSSSSGGGSSGPPAPPAEPMETVDEEVEGEGEESPN